MSDITKTGVVIVEKTSPATGIISMVLKCPEVAENAKPGQFINIYCNESSMLLPRPISLCEIDAKEGTIRIVFRIVGKGTEFISHFNEGESLEIMGPLGNGFDLDTINKTDDQGNVTGKKRTLVIGGGIGIPPMLELFKRLDCEKCAVLGFRDEIFLKEEFDKYGRCIISSEDGMHGTKGNVIDAIKAQGVEADIIFACGPMPMLKGLSAYATEKGMEAYISLEERMACGIGACLACVCKSKEKDHHTNVNNKRICKDGPVFDHREVEL